MKLLFRKQTLKIFFFLLSIPLVFSSNFFLQMCQNEMSFDLASKFAFSWHTEKFLLGCLVLALVYLFITSFTGSFWGGSLIYTFLVAFVGGADFIKMNLRNEPIYPDDFSMLAYPAVFKDILGTRSFVLTILFLLFLVSFVVFLCIRTRKKAKSVQLFRGILFSFSLIGLLYVSTFNSAQNLLRKEYDKTALWIPYSQTMNYYNVGFIGGFLYNLHVQAMEKPGNYSKQTVEKIVQKYPQTKEKTTDKPNIVFVMSESFSDPNRLNAIQTNANPIEALQKIANRTFHGQMLSQGYGGGTANIEFEALTGLSIEGLSAQLTTPYTQLVPTLSNLASIVSTLENRAYETTAIHPYNLSMYKRNQVYHTFGFDAFLSENSIKYKEKKENNPYISDESAYKEVLDVLKKRSTPQFVHLVTMQTHMPYENKYTNQNYKNTIDISTPSMEGYFEDLSYSSLAFEQFTKEIEQLDRRTLVVFWGDHLPSIYPEELTKKNQPVELRKTEFLFYDNKHKIAPQDELLSPIYFAPKLFSTTGIQTNGFQNLLLKLADALPAFEKGMYVQNGSAFEQKQLNQEQQAVYDDYRLIEYDLLSGKQYSMKTNFYN